MDEDGVTGSDDIPGCGIGQMTAHRILDDVAESVNDLQLDQLVAGGICLHKLASTNKYYSIYSNLFA